MPVTKDIADYLATLSIGAVGTSSFAGPMPETNALCYSFLPYSGSPPDKVWEAEYPRIQIRVRDADYATGFNAAYTVMKGLHNKVNVTVNAHLYYYISALSSPIYLGPDANGRHIFVVNVEAIKKVE